MKQEIEIEDPNLSLFPPVTANKMLRKYYVSIVTKANPNLGDIFFKLQVYLVNSSL
jgi:hypothetical protein